MLRIFFQLRALFTAFLSHSMFITSANVINFAVPKRIVSYKNVRIVVADINFNVI
jgi:hypothetical protein